MELTTWNLPFETYYMELSIWKLLFETLYMDLTTWHLLSEIHIFIFLLYLKIFSEGM